MVSIIDIGPYRGNRHQEKHSCRSDASDRVVGDIPYISPTAYIAVHTRQWPIWGIIRRTIMFSGSYTPFGPSFPHLALLLLTYLVTSRYPSDIAIQADYSAF
eukprot:5981924-Pleurochrysis_carterae.AAC.1